jgi:hypothetical protein
MIDDRRIGELALLHNLLPPQQLDEARRLQERQGGELYQILIEHSFVEEERCITVVADYLNIPCVSLRDFSPDPRVTLLLSPPLAARLRALPLGISEANQLYLAMANPLDVAARQEISDATQRDLVAFLAGPLDMEQALERAYGSAIYRVRGSLDDLFGADSAPQPLPNPNQSLSDLLSMPIPDPDLADEDAVRLESLQHLHPNLTNQPAQPETLLLELSSLPGAAASLRRSPPRPAPSLLSLPNDPFLEAELDELLDAADADLSNVAYALSAEPDPEIFQVSASKIFMRPEALTDLGRQRLQEVAAASPQRAADRNNQTRLGALQQMAAAPSGDDEAAASPAQDPRLARALRQADLNASSVPELRVPRELTQRSLRVLRARGDQPAPLDALLDRASDAALLRALTKLLVERGLISVDALRDALDRDGGAA